MLMLSSADLTSIIDICKPSALYHHAHRLSSIIPCPRKHTAPLQVLRAVPAVGAQLKSSEAFQEPQYLQPWACSPTVSPGLVGVPQPKTSALPGVNPSPPLGLRPVPQA